MYTIPNNSTLGTCNTKNYNADNSHLHVLKKRRNKRNSRLFKLIYF